MRLFKRKRRVSSTQQTLDSKPSMIRVGRGSYYVHEPYMLQKSWVEDNRLDFQHNLLKQAFGTLYHVPINPQAVALNNHYQIADIGCGTAAWSLEMARRFPNAHIIGYDLLQPPAVQREEEWQALSFQAQEELRNQGREPVHPPSRFEFLQGDIFRHDTTSDGGQRLTPDLGVFRENYFDFVFQRLLIAGMPSALFPAEVAELARITRSGGWIELVECTTAIRGGPAIQQINAWISDATKNYGIDTTRTKDIGEFLYHAHLTNIHMERIDLPFGVQHWWKGRRTSQLGQNFATNYLTAIEKSIAPLIDRYAIATKDHMTLVFADAYEEIRQPGDAYIPFYWAIAQKP